jgi:GTPase-associated protein 1, N-terminal domain type 2/GTPase-associated protein 1, middle domain
VSLELVHTSVQKGLRGGSGFATAVATRGMPTGLESVLEELSAYDFDPTRALGADRIDWAHRVVTLQGRTYSVISRTAPCGSDWSGRANRIAHHLVVEQHERAPAGPTWMLQAAVDFADEVPAVEERGRGPMLPQGGAVGPRPASAWTAAGFDAGWAGVVARTVLESPASACYLVFPSGCDVLPLLDDVFALIPAERRWMVTFSTRFQRAPSSAKCQLRCVRKGAAALRALLAEPGVRQFALEPGVSAGNSDAAEAARQGRVVAIAAPSSMRVDPVLRDSPASSSPQPALSRPAVGVAPRAPVAARAADPELDLDVGAEPATERDLYRAPSGDSNPLAMILFGIAGLALIGTFVLAVLMILRQSSP